MKGRRRAVSPPQEAGPQDAQGTLPSNLEHLFAAPAISPEHAAQLGGVLGNQAMQSLVGGGDGEDLGGYSETPGEAFAEATGGAGGAMPYRDEMESAFGQSFGDVRAHTGQREPLAGMSAEAATDGQQVAFADASPDRETVAHEAAHIAQGTNVIAAKSQLDTPGDAAEQEADAVASQAARGEPVSVSQTPSAQLHRYGGDEDEDDLEYREMDEDQIPEWTFTTASDPDAVLKDINIHAYDARVAAKKGVDDYSVLMSEINQLRASYDKDGVILDEDTMAEHRGRVSALRGTLNKQTTLVPAIDTLETLHDDWSDGKYEYRHLGGNEYKITAEGAAERQRRFDAYELEEENVKGQISDIQDALEKLALEVTASKNELRPYVADLVSAEVDDASTDFNTIAFGYGLIVPKEQTDAFDLHMEQKSAMMDDLEDTASGGDLSGEVLKQRREAVNLDRNADQNRLKISQALGVLASYETTYKKTLAELGEMLQDNDASDYYFSRGWDKFTDSIADDVSDLYDVEERFLTDRKNPDSTDGAGFLAAAKGATARIDKRIDRKGKEIIPKAKAGEAMGELVKTLTTLTEEYDSGWRNALPAMKEAVVQKRTYDALSTRLKKAQKQLKDWDDDGKMSTTADAVEAREEKARKLPDETRAAVEPKWFSYTGDIKTLRKHIKDNIGDDDGEYSDEDLKQADTQLNLAKMLDKYDNWYDLLEGARKGILEKCPEDKQAAALKHLSTFRKQLDADLKKELGSVIDPEAMKSMMEKLNDINDDVGLLFGDPGTKDMVDFEKKYLPKLINKAAWKAIIAEDGWRKNLGTLKSGVNKASTGVSLLLNADKILKAGDAVSMVDGSKHPGIEGLSACLDAVNTFNKVPVFGVLIDMYCVALEGISKQLAFISKQMARKRLQLAAITGTLDGPVMR